MTKAFKAGDKVLVARRDGDTSWTKGLTGTVVMQKPKKNVYGYLDNLDVLVEFSDKDANGQGHGDKGDGRYSSDATNRWWINSDRLDAAEETLTLGDKPFTTAHFKAGSQTSTILSHLLRGKTITNAESMLNYGIFRLSDCIHKIREAGFDVSMTLKRDEVGRKYASYSLPAKAA